MKTLGTDVSIVTCKAEGYTMIQFDARKRFNRATNYRIFSYYPEYTDIAGQLKTDAFESFDSLVSIYKENKTGINSFAETDKFVNFDEPDYRDFLNLASDIEAYRGL